MVSDCFSIESINTGRIFNDKSESDGRVKILAAFSSMINPLIYAATRADLRRLARRHLGSKKDLYKSGLLYSRDFTLTYSFFELIQ